MRPRRRLPGPRLHRRAPLRLSANLGKLPFSAESPDARRLARTVMAATDRLRRGHILLSPDQDMVLEGEFQIKKMTLKAGDSQFSPAGSMHAMIKSPTGCLVLVHA